MHTHTHTHTHTHSCRVQSFCTPYTRPDRARHVRSITPSGEVEYINYDDTMVSCSGERGKRTKNREIETYKLMYVLGYMVAYYVCTVISKTVNCRMLCVHAKNPQKRNRLRGTERTVWTLFSEYAVEDSKAENQTCAAEALWVQHPQ